MRSLFCSSSNRFFSYLPLPLLPQPLIIKPLLLSLPVNSNYDDGFNVVDQQLELVSEKQRERERETSRPEMAAAQFSLKCEFSHSFHSYLFSFFFPIFIYSSWKFIIMQWERTTPTTKSLNFFLFFCIVLALNLSNCCPVVSSDYLYLSYLSIHPSIQHRLNKLASVFSSTYLPSSNILFEICKFKSLEPRAESCATHSPVVPFFSL